MIGRNDVMLLTPEKISYPAVLGLLGGISEGVGGGGGAPQNWN